MIEQREPSQPDLLFRATTTAECQRLAPEIRADVRRLLKQLLTECATVARQPDE